MASEKNKIIVAGYEFNNANDAALAREEVKKVEYIRTHLDTSKPDKVLKVLKKAIEERIFKTPIGMDFIREIQMFLINQCGYAEEEVPCIPVTPQYNRALRSEAGETSGKSSAEKKEKVPTLLISVILNILLVIAVAAMFIITLKSDNPNILNYETAINNKYAYWAEQLDEQEKNLREKEKEIKIREIELKEREAELETDN